MIGHIGRFVKQKNHDFLIDIFNDIHKNNNESILLLIGQGPLLEEIKNKIESLGLSDSVRFLGQRNDVNDFYQVMDAFVFPSIYEGLGMVLIEAQCSGLPCFASTEVPETAKVTDNLIFVSLSQNANVWTNMILKKTGHFSRKSNEKEIKDSGYDIKEESIKLLNKYYYLIEGGK